jgi:hypothetical protein
VKLIFLDVDGVLNSIESMLVLEAMDKLCPVRIGLVARLAREADAKIVVSSSWRTGRLENTVKLLTEAGAGCLAPYITSETPRLGTGKRGDEIAAWLAKQGDVECYVILDDDSDMLPDQPFVHTSMACGFGLDDYLDALAILAPDHKDLSPLRGLAAYRGHWKRKRAESVPSTDSTQEKL